MKEINCDIEDVEDVLKKIEASYGIKFLPYEMENLKTFGEISDHIIFKINLEDKDDCSSQQAFYKLKNAILKVTKIPENRISPSTTLEKVFPIKRRKYFSLIEKELNLDLKAFCISNSIVITILILLLISIITIFFNWKYGLFGLFFTIIFAKISDKTTTKFSEKTVGELAKSMMLENYTQSRRNSDSYNNAEIKKNLEMLFIKELGLSKEFEEFSDDTIIVS